MNKVAAYLLMVLSLVMATIKPLHASTEYIVYSFNMVDVYTEVAKGAIDKVSQYSQIINSSKTMVGGYLGDKIAAAQEKVELAQEKVENAQEKAEKIQERIEWAKEKKQALMDKYNELSTKIAEYKQKAEESIQKGMEIREKYKTYAGKVSEYKDKVTDAINDAKELKDKVENKVNEAKGLAEEKINQAKEQAGIQPNSTPTAAQDPKAISNQAAAIVSAGQLAEKTVLEAVSTAEIENLEQEVPILQQTNISAEEVMKSAKNIKQGLNEQQSNTKLEDQLVMSASKTDLKNSVKKEEKIIKDKEVVSKRKIFETTKEEKNAPLEAELKETAKKDKGVEK